VASLLPHARSGPAGRRSEWTLPGRDSKRRIPENRAPRPSSADHAARPAVPTGDKRRATITAGARAGALERLFDSAPLFWEHPRVSGGGSLSPISRSLAAPQAGEDFHVDSRLPAGGRRLHAILLDHAHKGGMEAVCGVTGCAGSGFHGPAGLGPATQGFAGSLRIEPALYRQRQWTAWRSTFTQCTGPRWRQIAKAQAGDPRRRGKTFMYGPRAAKVYVLATLGPPLITRWAPRV